MTLNAEAFKAAHARLWAKGNNIFDSFGPAIEAYLAALPKADGEPVIYRYRRNAGDAFDTEWEYSEKQTDIPNDWEKQALYPTPSSEFMRGVEAAARLVEEHAITFTNSDETPSYLSKRRHNDQSGIQYAAAIRKLASPLQVTAPGDDEDRELRSLAIEALAPFVVLADERDAIYRKRGGNPDSFPDKNPAYDIAAARLPNGVWRKARTALSALSKRATRAVTTSINAESDALCSDCPPDGYPTDETRCEPCPRRSLKRPQSSEKET